MKNLKSIISIFLAIMIFVSVFSVFSVNAADSVLNITGEDSFTKTYGASDFNLGLSVAVTSAKENMTYSSADSTIATVDHNGNVSIKGCGKTTITANTKVINPSYFVDKTTYLTADKKVTVTVNPKQIDLGKVGKNKKKKTVKLYFTKQPNCKYKLQLGLMKGKKFVSKIPSIAKKSYSPNKNYITVSNVLPGFKYYYRMRSFATIDGKKVYGDWTVSHFKL